MFLNNLNNFKNTFNYYLLTFKKQSCTLKDREKLLYYMIESNIRRSKLISFINRTLINMRFSIILKRIKDFRLKRNIKYTELAILSYTITQGDYLSRKCFKLIRTIRRGTDIDDKIMDLPYNTHLRSNRICSLFLAFIIQLFS